MALQLGARRGEFQPGGVDRPGIGKSTSQRVRTYAGWAADLTAIADALAELKSEGCDLFLIAGASAIFTPAAGEPSAAPGAAAAIKASRGAVRSPLPTRSRKRMASTADQAVAKATSGRMTFDNA